MKKLTRKDYRFQVTGFDSETNAHIEQHRKNSLTRKHTTFTPLQKTLAEIVQQIIATTSQRKAA